MLPYITLGSWTISTHLLLDLSAAIVVGVLAKWRSRREYPNLALAEIIDLTFYLFCGVLGGALIGALLPYLIMALFGKPLPPWWWMGWQNWFGAVAGGSLSGLLYCRRHQRPIGWSFDLFAPLLPVGLILVRTGCLLAGDSHGKETTDWPAMFLPDPSGYWASRYPTQIVDILLGVLIAILLFSFDGFVQRCLKKPQGWPFAGFKFWLYVFLFCSQRFYFEFWRADTPLLFGSLTWNHLYAAGGLILAVGVTAYRMRAAPGARV